MFQKAVYLILLLLMVLPPCLFSQNEEKDVLIDLDQYLQFKMERDKIPGMAVCLVKDGEIVWSKGYGWAGIEQNMVMSENSIIGVASISKLVTAVAILKLSEKKLLKLEDPINNYLPFKIHHPDHPGSEMTIAQILSHTASIDNGPSLWRSYNCGKETISLGEWARSYFLPEGQSYHKEGNFGEWKPGENFLYSNAGYGLLAYLVEVVSGMPFNQYCRENIFDPLQMKNSSFEIGDLNEARLATMYAYGYTWDLERDLMQENVDFSSIIRSNYFFPLCQYNTPTIGASGLYSTISDLAKFLSALMNEGVYHNKVILSRESMKKLFNPYVDASLLPGQFAAFGLGGYAMKLGNGEPVWGHTGADPGLSNFLLFNPEINIGAIVLANRFVDIRDLIEWCFAEGFANFCDKSSERIKQSWRQYSNSEKKWKIIFRVKPNYLPGGSQLYLIGNHRYLGCWTTAGIPLLPQKDGSWEKTFFFNDSTQIAFKITRGSWDTEAVTFSDGKPLPDFNYIVRQDTVFNIVIEDWKDLRE